MSASTVKLYSIQNYQVLAEVCLYKIYKPKWELCDWIHYDSCIAPGYIWIVDEYNRRKNNEYLGPLVWWYTDIKEALRIYKEDCKKNSNLVLISADVPEKDILFQDADLWSRGPFCGWPLGFLSSPTTLSEEWTDKCKEFYNKMYASYEKNRAATSETWKECLNITKQTERIHALTPYILLEYIDKDYKLNIE